MSSSMHHVFVSAATGLVLICSGAACAKQKAAVVTVPEAQRPEAQSLRHEAQGSGRRILCRQRQE